METIYSATPHHRIAKSESLAPHEHEAYKTTVAAKLRELRTQQRVAQFFDFKSVITLHNILLKGTGHPTSLQKIREKLSLPPHTLPNTINPPL